MANNSTLSKMLKDIILSSKSTTPVAVAMKEAASNAKS